MTHATHDRSQAQREETLDPEDWSAFRSLAHRMLDETIDHLASIREAPAWRPMPDAVKDAIRKEPLPRTGQGPEAVYADFLSNVRPYPTGNIHPRFFGWVQGTGTPLAMLADMLASALNPHMAGFNQAPALVEERVIDWLAELMGFPKSSSGILVTGGTMASVLGLAVARHVKAGFDVRVQGLQQRDGPLLTVYCSSETHGWAKKAMQVLGLGDRALRTIAVDREYRVDLGALRAAIADDRRAGHRPICVIGTAGTVNTGATDDLAAIAELCARENLWFHVDGAFGAFARLSPSRAHLVRGLERADSLAFDLHKWMYLPYDIACVLVRDGKLHRETFAMRASYISKTTRGVIAGGLPFADLGIDLTRGFKALKAWMCLKAHGVDQFARLIEQNIRQAEHLAALVEAHPKLELAAPAPLNVVCFRYRYASATGEALDRLNQELLVRMQERGIAVPSHTVLDGRFALRCAIVNHRSRMEDFDAIVKAAVDLGDELVREMRL